MTALEDAYARVEARLTFTSDRDEMDFRSAMDDLIVAAQAVPPLDLPAPAPSTVTIQISLPDHTVLPPGDGPFDHYSDPGLCAGCQYEQHGRMIRLHPHGWFHAENEDGGRTCLEKELAGIQQGGREDPWVAVAKHVAKYPSKHTVSTLRSVITNLLRLIPAPTV